MLPFFCQVSFSSFSCSIFSFLTSPKQVCIQTYPLIRICTQDMHSHFRSSLKATRKNFMHYIQNTGTLTYCCCLTSGFNLEQHPCRPWTLRSTSHTPNEQRTSQPTTLNQEIRYVPTMVLKEPVLVCTLTFFPPMTDEKQRKPPRSKDPNKLQQAGHKQTPHTLIQPKVALFE